MGYNPRKLSASERGVVELLKQFQTMWVGDLFKYEGDLDKLVNFLGKVTLVPLYHSFFFI